MVLIKIEDTQPSARFLWSQHSFHSFFAADCFMKKKNCFSSSAFTAGGEALQSHNGL